MLFRSKESAIPVVIAVIALGSLKSKRMILVVSDAEEGSQSALIPSLAGISTEPISMSVRNRTNSMMDNAVNKRLLPLNPGIFNFQLLPIAKSLFNLIVIDEFPRGK